MSTMDSTILQAWFSGHLFISVVLKKDDNLQADGES